MRLARTALALILTAGVAAGCSSDDAAPGPSASATPSPVVTGEDNGLGEAKARAIYRQAREAATGAQSYAVRGSIPGGQNPLELQFDFTSTSSRGQLTPQDSEPIELVITPESVFVKGEDALDPSIAGPDAEKTLEGKWLQVPASDPSAQAFAAFANGPTFANNLMRPQSQLSKGEVGEFEGVPAVELVSTGSLWISTVGEPYPVAVMGTEDATVRFSQWNAIDEIEEPPADEVVTLGDLVFD
jgi:hypothetical protein